MRALAAISLFLGLAACGSAAEQLVRSELRDPGSAQFRNVRSASGGTTCGEVNGKNAFGAYAGFRRFYTIGRTAFLEPEVEAGTPPAVTAQLKSLFDKQWKVECSPV